MKKLQKIYSSLEKDIAQRLNEFSSIWENGSDTEIFRELCFCVCTPQTSAHKGWSAACALFDKKLLEKGSLEQVAAVLRECGVRFHKNKAAYIMQNREKFYPKTKKIIGEILSQDDPQSILCAEVTGWGMKEAAHFMRNIGFGDKACILDRHILRQLVIYNVITEIPKTLSKTTYKTIDAEMKKFAERCKIPLAALDLVFWYEETGEIFK
jgi:N-glycosylase/DNA lyase